MSFNEWERALLTYDAEVIRATADKFHVHMPEDKRQFWIAVSMAILRIKNASAFDRETAFNIQREIRSIPHTPPNIGTPFRQTTAEGTFANAMGNGMDNHAKIKPQISTAKMKSTSD